MKTAFYSFGAGLGHISRTIKIIQTLKLDGCVVFTDSQFVSDDKSIGDRFKKDGIEFLYPRGGEPFSMGQLCDQLQSRSINELYIDSFPVGLRGELNGLSDCLPSLRLNLVARALTWAAYQPFVRQPNEFDKCLVVEALSGDYTAFLTRYSKSLESFPLRSVHLPEIVPSWVKLPKVYCAVVHSGPNTEVMALLTYAERRLRMQKRDIPIVIFSPTAESAKFGGYRVIRQVSLKSLLGGAQVLVSAAGFNTVNEMSGSGCEHWMVPFCRRYDDQYGRANASRCGAGTRSLMSVE